VACSWHSALAGLLLVLKKFEDLLNSRAVGVEVPFLR